MWNRVGSELVDEQIDSNDASVNRESEGVKSLNLDQVQDSDFEGQIRGYDDDSKESGGNELVEEQTDSNDALVNGDLEGVKSLNLDQVKDSDSWGLETMSREHCRDKLLHTM